MTTTGDADQQRPPPERVYTLEELKRYDGNGGEETILVGLNGKVYDVTAGKNFYGTGGPYAVFAGRDATIGLATFNMAKMKRETNVELVLSEKHQRNVRHWEKLFGEKYKLVGTFEKPPPPPPPPTEDPKDTQTSKTKLVKTVSQIFEPPEEEIMKKKKSKLCSLL
ncbi:Membrane-associated progesterone receptor component 1 [Lamellibrachia satsuma]|nr:Membrane-associated progesterone receptor component 1 [Lamellibrachia satsuma]